MMDLHSSLPVSGARVPSRTGLRCILAPEGQKITAKGVAADVIGGAVGRSVAGWIKASAANSPQGKYLARVADRAERVAVGGRASRVAAAKAATANATAYGTVRAGVAGAVGSNAVSKVVDHGN